MDATSTTNVCALKDETAMVLAIAQAGQVVRCETERADGWACVLYSDDQSNMVIDGWVNTAMSPNASLHLAI